jgi:hypothetical protein
MGRRVVKSGSYDQNRFVWQRSEGRLYLTIRASMSVITLKSNAFHLRLRTCIEVGRCGQSHTFVDIAQGSTADAEHI